MAVILVYLRLETAVLFGNGKEDGWGAAVVGSRAMPMRRGKRGIE